MLRVNAYGYVNNNIRSVRCRKVVCTLFGYISFSYKRRCYSVSSFLKGIRHLNLYGEQMWIPTFFRYVVNLNITYFRLNRVFEGTYWRDFYLIKILDYLLLTDNYFICLKLIDIKKLMFILIILLT